MPFLKGRFAVGSRETQELELGFMADEFAGLLRVVGLAVCITELLHFPRCRFSLYLTVSRLDFAQICLFRVADVVISRDSSFEF